MIHNPYKIINDYRKIAPVNVEELTRVLGLELRYANMSNDYSGSIEKKRNSYVITINENHPKTRQRFTIAHELGHYILHRRKIGDGVTDDDSYRSNPESKFQNFDIGRKEETEANQLAVNILMPLELIEHLREEGYNTAEKLAPKLGVSLESIKIRLENIPE